MRMLDLLTAAELLGQDEGELAQRGDFRNFLPFARLRFAAVFRQKRPWLSA